MSSLYTDSDFTIFLLVAVLTMFGVVMVFSAGYYSTLAKSTDAYYFLKRQIAFAVSGFAILLAFSKLDYHSYSKYYKQIAVFSVVMLLLLFTPLGVTVNFARRWIFIGPIRITPSEISKLAMIIFTATYLAENPNKAKQGLVGMSTILGLMALHAGLIIKQPNLSTAIVIVAIMIGILFVGGLAWRYIIVAIGSLTAGMISILMFFRNTHWYSRLTNWMDPFKDAQGEGYQVSQSIIALGNGGFKGLGLGKSISKNLYLPEPQNDFILAIIGEELGFIGIFIMMVVYLVLIWRCIMVSSKAKDKLGLFMAAGIAIMLGLQVIVNVAVVTASMPATGITLPFVSYGGTSLWVFMASMGIMLNISKQGRAN
ncbi:cell division protein FtsW [Mogibacterium pumilum]|uniref:Probable peptidoglycan glycosyltransferase FtsW n=2 Tax=Mogibacterium pumilum TaxID=86332 RepID=A0A223AU45_9FIRM|nr:cell division protein FtsW [Mogibacterium pumilum]